MEQSEDYCRAWVRASPDIVKVRFDDEAKAVKTSVLGLVRGRAVWVDEQSGCQLE